MSVLKQTLNVAYDILTAMISLADVTTDVWVAYRFYTTGKFAFFWVSTVVMILAQLAYTVAFTLRFAESSNIRIRKKICVFFCVLPLAPVMSFIFYWASRPDNCISKILRYFGLDTDESVKPDKNEPQITRWIKEKFEKHMGFILEAVIEAFPQSILQMIAIVYYNETEIINVVSILISLISVSTKSLVFSYAIEVKVFIFNWLSLVTDFFGIFMLISWIFYNPLNPGQLTWYGTLWLYKSVFINGLLIVFIGGAMALMFMSGCWKHEISSSRKQGWNCCQSACVQLMLFVFTLILYVCGSALALLLLEVACLCPIAFFAFLINHERFTGSTQRSSLFIRLFNWLYAARNKQDEIVRICCINRCMFVSKLHNNRIFQSYLLRNESSSFRNVTLPELRYRVAPLYPEKAQLKAHFIHFYMNIPNDVYKDYNDQKKLAPDRRDREKYIMYAIGRVWISMIFFVLFPLHFVSRVINLVYPIIVLCVIDIHHIALLQGIMTFSWLTLLVIWIVMFAVNLKFEYLTWHIAPGVGYFNTSSSLDVDKFEQKLTSYYDKIYLAPIREQHLIQLFGEDIAQIIISMLDIFEDDED